MLESDTPVAMEFRQAMWEIFKITKPADFYPMMDMYGLYKPSLIPVNIRSAFKLDDWESYTAYIFGKTRTPRLKVPVANTEPYVVALAHEARGLISEDTLVKFVANTHFDDELAEQFKPHTPNIRKMLKSAPVEAREKLFSRGIDFLDTQRIKLITNSHGRMYRNYPINDKVTSWEEAVTAMYGDRFNDVNYLSDV
jgi:hypothetical protein